MQPRIIAAVLSYLRQTAEVRCWEVWAGLLGFFAWGAIIGIVFGKTW